MQSFPARTQFTFRSRQDVGFLIFALAISGVCYWWRYAAQESFDRFDLAAMVCGSVFFLTGGALTIGLLWQWWLPR